MEWKDVIGELIRLVQATAPELWCIANRQVSAQVVEMCVWVVVLFGATGGSAWLARLCHKNGVSDPGIGEWFMGEATAWTFALVALFIAIGLTTGVLKRCLNPDYYTIAVLMNLVK